MKKLIFKIHEINGFVVSSLGICGNFLLLFLIISTKDKSLKKFSRVLLQNCILESILAVVTFFSQPQFLVNNGNLYFIIGSFMNHVEPQVASFLASSYSAFAMTTLFAMFIPFYIRYCLLVKESTISIFRLIILYIIVFIDFVAIYALVLQSYWPQESTFPELQKALNTTFWTEEYGHVPAFGTMDLSNIYTYFSWTLVFASVSSSCGLIIYFSLKISKSLKEKATVMSAHTKRLNNQLQLTMVIQAIVPCVTGNFPLIILLIMIILKLENAYIPLLCSLIVGWIPVINPLIAIYIITPYRRKLLSFHRRFLVSTNSMTTTTSTA